MNRKLQWVAVVAALAVILHLSAVWAIPRVAMSAAMNKLGGDGALNVFTHWGAPTDQSRAVVRPSPDLAYSICILDLSAGPVRIEVPASAPYTSLAPYSSITDNYFVRNNREDGGLQDGEVIGIVVTGPGGDAPANLPAGFTTVTAPTKKGLALVRRVIENGAAMPRLDALRAVSVCTPLQG